MIRSNFYITKRETLRLKELSNQTGLSASEIVRRAIDEYTEKYLKKGDITNE